MYLYHKKDKVAKISFSTPTIIEEIEEVYEPALMPCQNVLPLFQKITMQKWLMSRTISFSRRDIKNIRDFFGTDILTSKYKMSLFDDYFFADTDEEAEEIMNYRYFDEKDRFISLLFSPERYPEEEFSDITPNLSFSGSQARFWHNSDNGLFLLNQNAKFDMGFQIAENSLQTGVVLPREYKIYEGFVHTSIPFEALGINSDIEALPFWCFLGQITKDTPKKEIIDRTIGEAIPNYMDFFEKMNNIDEALGYDRPLENLYLLRDKNTLEIQDFMRI